MDRYASLSLDLDNQWSYMKTHGDVGWETYPSYLGVVVPRVLEILDRFGLKITFFVVGRDLLNERNLPCLQQAVQQGHELANHSFSHDTWLHLYTREQIEREIEQTEVQIEKLSGRRPLGFRGPGFCWSEDLLEVLARRGYLYDATSLPTFIGPLARRYYFKTSSLTEEEKRQRSKIFGASLAEGFGPLRPFQWRLPSGNTMLELPVTTMPVLRVPFHMSYLMYLSRISVRLMRAYLSTALALCVLTATAPSFLLHPLDLLGGEEVPELAFFPGMDMTAVRKHAIFVEVLARLTGRFRVVGMSEHARIATQGSRLRRVGFQARSSVCAGQGQQAAGGT